MFQFNNYLSDYTIFGGTGTFFSSSMPSFYGLYTSATTWSEICSQFWKYLNTTSIAPLEPNPLTILSRSVSILKLCRVILQPRWKRGRWKSKS